MNKKLLNILLLLFFQFGYLEWGTNNSLFIFQAEQIIFTKGMVSIKEVLHPFTLIPFAGLVLLIFTLFQSTPSRKLSLIALVCLSILMVLLFFISLLSLNIKMLLSTIPFIVTGCIMLFNKKNSPTP